MPFNATNHTDFGWRGKRVRHLPTGKLGTIRREFGIGLVEALVELDDGTHGLFILDALHENRGTDDWQWFCTSYDPALLTPQEKAEGGRWLSFASDSIPLNDADRRHPWLAQAAHA